MTRLQEKAAPEADDQAKLVSILEGYKNVQHEPREKQALQDANTSVPSEKGPSLAPPEVCQGEQEKEPPRNVVERATGVYEIAHAVHSSFAS